MTALSFSAPQTVAQTDGSTELFDQLENLQETCNTWQMRTLKNSNDQLYAILGECFDMIGTLRDSKPLRKQLNTFLEQRGCTVKSNTAIERKVVTFVFGIGFKQIDSYTSILKRAKERKPKGKTMVEWLNAEGGIDGVRRPNNSGKSATEMARFYAQKAEDVLAEADPIGDRFEAHEALLPQDCGDYDLSVGLIRHDNDGKAAIVFCSNKSTIVRTVLAQAGKEQVDQAKLELEAKERDSVQEAQDALIRELAGEHDLAA